LVIVVSVWTILLLSAAEPARAATKSGHEFYLLMGEKMVRSGEFREAREVLEKALELNIRDARAHYFLGLIEYEEGNIEKAKTRFQIAHESLGSLSEAPELSVDAREVQLEFPHEYEAKIYYKDGWYVKSKKKSIDPLTDRPIDLLTLEAGSTYRIELTPAHKESWIRRGMIGLIVAFSFFLAR
jgi:tetratricopeptide (TPR) repeat protein